MRRSDAEQWSRLVTALAGRQDGTTLTVASLCSSATDALAVTGAAIVLMGDEAAGAAYASNAVVDLLEELQATVGVGPGADAFTHQVPVIATDLVDHPPAGWMGFAGAAVEAGVRAVFAFPLQVGAARLGVLTLYQDRAGPLGEGCYADALVVAGIVTRAVLGMQAGAPDDVLAAELSDGEVSRAEVHQASGMVSAQLDVGVGEALVRLRARAFAEGTTLRGLAGGVVAGRVRLDS